MKLIRFIIIILISLSLYGCSQESPVTSVGSLSKAQVKDVQKIIHDYLVKNPQVLVEASQAYQDQEMAKAKSKTQQAVSKNAKVLFSSATSPTVGNINGDVTVVEFLDYQCTHCREMSAVIDNLIKADPKVRVVIKQLPIFGGASKFAAQASIASIQQGPEKFLALHRAILEMPLPITNEKVLDAAKKIGLNIAKLQADINSKNVTVQLDENFKLAQDLGLLGTPAFIIGNRSGNQIEYLPGVTTVENLQKSINQVRK